MRASGSAVDALTTSPPTVLAAAAAGMRPNVRLIALLALGHFVIDVNQGSLAAVLPFLRRAHGLSYSEAGAIVLAANLTSSVIQPAFGLVSDRLARRWLLPLALLVSGLGISLTGIAAGYGSLLALVVVMGLGVAAYHPEGYRAATSVAGARKATALSWFSLGGNIGTAAGPAIMTALVTALGVAGTLGLLAPSLVMSVVLLAALPWFGRAAAAPAVKQAPRAAAAPSRSMPGAMALLILVVAIRSWSSLGYTAFVPFYYVDVLKADPRLVGPLLFVFLGAGALGTMAAGPIADRVGPRAFMRWVFLAAVPFGLLFLHSDGLWRFVALGCFGAALTSSFSVSVVLGQAYLPARPALASGLIVGLAIGTGGVAVALLGTIADRWGVPAALWVGALLPILGFAVTRLLPAPQPAVGSGTSQAVGSAASRAETPAG